MFQNFLNLKTNVESRNNDKKACFRVFAFRGEDTKTRNDTNQPPYKRQFNSKFTLQEHKRYNRSTKG